MEKLSTNEVECLKASVNASTQDKNDTLTVTQYADHFEHTSAYVRSSGAPYMLCRGSGATPCVDSGSSIFPTNSCNATGMECTIDTKGNKQQFRILNFVKTYYMCLIFIYDTLMQLITFIILLKS